MLTASYRSPASGAALEPDTPHSLAAPGERWPVVDGIPFLRTGREDLARDALACLDQGDRDGALLRLLPDADDWWDGPAPDPDALRRLVRSPEAHSLRDAMTALAYGRVGDYFAHRWSDPTFLAGLALVDGHWNAPGSAFELACGIGHHLRELAARGVAVSGADVVFSKLWLARHWVLGSEAALVCFDAEAPWPVAAEAGFDLVLCQDAFYFFAGKARILSALRDMLSPRGLLAIGHVHNSEAVNASAGRGVSAAELAALFPDGIVYDDAELTRAAASGRPAPSRAPAALRDAEAFAVAAGPAAKATSGRGGPLVRPPDGAALRRNPLYDASGALSWPSERYRSEYAPLATYPARSRAPERAVMGPDLADAARRRELVSLPERW